MPTMLTGEQRKIIHHPLGKHARVLAVAGSGKTTTMVHRVKYLVQELRQDSRRIKVLMFNRAARRDFEGKLSEEDIGKGQQPKVQTFHSLAAEMISLAQKEGLLPSGMELWEEEREELALICMHRVVDSLIREGLLTEDVDPQEALDAVGLWKASLIPPERAAHRTNPDLPLVYQRFEELRNRSRGYTYDDFVPLALKVAQRSLGYRRCWNNQWDHLIVDEYQDVNYGQQQLIRLLAGTRADVMIVGDDDQTIYEWRAARPYYILEGFKTDFSNKHIVDYPLSHTFRFGPLLAQVAQNVIAFNDRRERKSIIARSVDQDTEIDLIAKADPEFEMASEVVRLVREGVAKPHDMAVLGRTYAQLGGLQTIFVQHKIPFLVEGAVTIFDRDENRTLVDYIRLAMAWDQAPSALKSLKTADRDDDSEDAAQSRTRKRSLGQKGETSEAVRIVLAVANTPSRMIPRGVLQNAVEEGTRLGLSMEKCITQLLDPETAPLRKAQRENIGDLVDVIEMIREELARGVKVDIIFDKIIERTGYLAHFERYYGEGLPSMDRQESVRLFVAFAKSLKLGAVEFVEFLRHLDTKQGLARDKVIKMTTIHRTKGLDFAYVFIPACLEGYIPVHIADDAGIYDKEGIVPDHPSSPAIENERRLFYVGITRARKRVYIGAHRKEETQDGRNTPPQQSSRFLEEIQVAPTRDLIRFVQTSRHNQLQEEGSRELLEKCIRPWASQHQLVHSVINNYLSDVSFGDLVKSVDGILGAVPEIGFSYRERYPQMDMRGRFTAIKEKSEPEEDVDPWADIGITL